jgi:hypothetical protein
MEEYQYSNILCLSRKIELITGIKKTKVITYAIKDTEDESNK